MRVLITGASGFLAHYVKIALMEKYEDLSLVGLSQSAADISGYQRIYDKLETLISEEDHFDLIVHLAAHIPYDAMNVASAELLKTNVELTRRLVEAYPQEKMVFSSSVSVYGEASGPIRIDSDFNQPNAYAQSKIAAEECVQSLKSYAIIRFTSLVGKGMTTTSFIPKIFEDAKTSKQITLVGKGQRKQNYLDVRDAALMCLRASESKENIVALGVGVKSYSNEEVATYVSKITNAKIQYREGEEGVSKVYETKDSYKLFNFVPNYSVFDSIDKLLEDE